MSQDDSNLMDDPTSHSTELIPQLPTDLDTRLSDQGHLESELSDDNEPQIEKDIRSTSKEMFCFHCNRFESHGVARTNRWFGNFLLGLTFGLIKWIGPFYCRCCGNPRLMWYDQLNLRYHLYRYTHSRPSSPVRRRRKK